MSTTLDSTAVTSSRSETDTAKGEVVGPGLVVASYAFDVIVNVVVMYFAILIIFYI
tara:strand:- start:832 stop:999 length:168 start_codon:yes stop_codon:yes gene_type:complete